MVKKQVYMRDASGTVFGTFFPEYHKECENLGSGDKAFQARREYAKSELRKMIKPGDTVYCIVRSVSNSGMSRVISLYIVQNGQLSSIDGLASDVLAYRDATNSAGFIVGGGGMDMCFGTVYNLGRYLFPQGFGIVGKDLKTGKESRPNTKRQADSMVKRGFVFLGRNCDSSGWDTNGGYALKHETL